MVFKYLGDYLESLSDEEVKRVQKEGVDPSKYKFRSHGDDEPDTGESLCE